MQGNFATAHSLPHRDRPGAVRAIQASGAPAPLAAYSHGMEIEAGARLVFLSGQLAIGEQGAVPPGCEAQAELCFRQIATLLQAVDLDLCDVVRINAFVTAREHMKPYMAVRDRLFAEPYPASTLMIVGGFTREEFVVEVEVVAAGPARTPGGDA